MSCFSFSASLPHGFSYGHFDSMLDHAHRYPMKSQNLKISSDFHQIQSCKLLCPSLAAMSFPYCSLQLLLRTKGLHSRSESLVDIALIVSLQPSRFSEFSLNSAM
ncbi:hypothetical protein O6H91_Y539600 [Diphasiastrum complanatum]|nr:hypothetical protein O6H91_Y539600 [Diphasiastrum complanatum]